MFLHLKFLLHIQSFKPAILKYYCNIYSLSSEDFSMLISIHLHNCVGLLMEWIIESWIGQAILSWSFKSITSWSTSSYTTRSLLCSCRKSCKIFRLYMFYSYFTRRIRYWKAFETPKKWSWLSNPITHRHSFMMSDILWLLMILPFIF